MATERTAFSGIRGWLNRLTGQVFTLTVDASEPAPTLIPGGRYDAVNKDIVDLARRTPPGSGYYDAEFTVVRFRRPVLYRDLESRLRGLGLRPADFRELLVYGATRPRRRELVVAVADDLAGVRTGREIPCISDRVSAKNRRWLSTCTVLYSVGECNCVLAAKL